MASLRPLTRTAVTPTNLGFQRPSRYGLYLIYDSDLHISPLYIIVKYRIRMESRIVWRPIPINTPLFGWHEWKGDGVGCATCTTRAATPDHIQPFIWGRRKEVSISIKEIGGTAPSFFHWPHTTVRCSRVYRFMWYKWHNTHTLGTLSPSHRRYSDCIVVCMVQDTIYIYSYYTTYPYPNPSNTYIFADWHVISCPVTAT